MCTFVISLFSILMGMFDRKWVNTLPNFDSAKVPHIPKNVIDQLTPNLECKITLNCSSKVIEISEYDYHYSEINGPGWYNNMTRLPSYAFPMPNYRLRAKLMALARKGSLSKRAMLWSARKNKMASAEPLVPSAISPNT